MSLHGFDQVGAKRIVNAVRQVERVQPPMGGPGRLAPMEVQAFARITDTTAGDGTYLATEVRRHDSAMADHYPKRFSDATLNRFTTIREIDAYPRMRAGEIVPVWVHYTPTGDTVEDGPYTEEWVFASCRRYGSLFPVAVTTDGGTEGDEATACSFTYTVETIDADPEELLTEASPLWARPAAGVMVVATQGLAYIDSVGDVILYQVDEVPDMEVCS